MSVILFAVMQITFLGLTNTFAAGVVGNGTAASCNAAALDAALSGGGVVSFNCGPNPLTILVNSTKQIAQNTEIRGENLITLSAGNARSHFQVFLSATLTLKDLTVSQGYGTFGGAIENFGVLSLVNSQATFNNSLDSGGAIVNHGTMSLTNSTIANNTAKSFGGGLYNDGEVTISGGQISDNSVSDGFDNGTGGGIWNSGTLRASSVVMARNNARDGGGGGIHNTGTLNLDRVTLENNTTSSTGTGSSGGGLNHSAGTATLSRVTFHGNYARYYGGGLFIGDVATLTANETIFTANYDFYTGGAVVNVGDFTLTNSLVQGNTSGAGGGIIGSGVAGAGRNAAKLINVTVSGNVSAGVTSADGTLTLTYCTIVGNQGAGIEALGGNITLKNTIVAGNASSDCLNAVTSNGYNIAGDFSCVFMQIGDQNATDPMLGPLANNGGPTLTHMPQTGSPVIDNGQCVAGITTDQRGAPRPFNVACDVGAVEYGARVQKFNPAAFLPMLFY